MEYLKETKQYCFSVSSDNFLALNGVPTISMDDGSVVIYLNGLVFCDKNELLRGFREKGPPFVEFLEGSFIIFLLIDGAFHILTDKLNSKRAFYLLVNQTWIISNNIDLLPLKELPLSIKGISCYLVFGNMFDGITLFEGVETTQRSSLHSFSGNMVQVVPYWDLTYSNTEVTENNKLEEELQGLLYESISKFSSASDRSAISLSAGYDARNILGLLRYYINLPALNCFSYGFNPFGKELNDTTVSKRLSDLCNYSHFSIISYQGNLVELLQQNAKTGKCLANLCAELDALNYIKKNITLSDVFVGDQILDSVSPTDSFEIRVFDMLKHDHKPEMKWLANYLDRELFTKLSETLIHIKADILRKVENINNIKDKQDYLYFDQRVCHVMMPWREYFTGIVGFVHNPLLYGPILEFVQKLPQELRFKKKLFLDLSKKMFPELFSIAKPAISGNNFNWPLELFQSKQSLLEMVEKTNSRFDKIVSKEQIRAIINAQPDPVKIKSFKNKAFRFLIKLGKKNKILNRLVNYSITRGLVSPVDRSMSPDRAILRLLLMRIYLSN